MQIVQVSVQSMNKVSTVAQLRFDIRNSPSLTPKVKERLIILIAWVRKALEKPRLRKPTRPGVTAKAARVSARRKRGEAKRARQDIPEDWE